MRGHFFCFRYADCPDMAWVCISPVYVDAGEHYTEAHDNGKCSMNARQLAKLGVPHECVPQALQVVQAVVKHNRSVPKDQRINVEETIRACVEQPDLYREEDRGGEAAEHAASSAAHEAALRQLAEALVADRAVCPPGADPLSHLGRRD